MTDYQYTECGLDNVYVAGMPELIDHAGEEVFEIQNVAGLHKCIAYCIITHEYGMGPKELRFLRTEVGLTQAQLAELVKKDQQSVGRWERGECPIDGTAEVIIRMFAAEKLGIRGDVSLEELARKCVANASFQRIVIDGSNPERYCEAA